MRANRIESIFSDSFRALSTTSIMISSDSEEISCSTGEKSISTTFIYKYQIKNVRIQPSLLQIALFSFHTPHLDHLRRLKVFSRVTNRS